MAEYFVIFNGAPQDSSDAQLGTAPIASTKILSPLQTANFVQVEAADVAHAQKAVQAAYPGARTGTPVLPLAGTAFTGNALSVALTSTWKES